MVSQKYWSALGAVSEVHCVGRCNVNAVQKYDMMSKHV